MTDIPPGLPALPSPRVTHPISRVFWEGMNHTLSLPSLLTGAWMPDFERSGISQARAELWLP